MLQSFIDGFLDAFRQLDANAHAKRELRQARVAWLQAQTDVDRADAAELYYRQKVQRLTEWLEREGKTEDKTEVARKPLKPRVVANPGLLRPVPVV